MKRPSKIVCVGRNYAAHAKEMGNDVPTTPIIFLKPPSSIIGNGDKIVLPPSSNHVEFEGEIGLLIGRELRRATPEQAAPAISAVVAANDVTARDHQRGDGQWTRAKGFDTFCPLGTPAPLSGRFNDLELVTRVNGVQRQHGKSRDMVFDIPSLVSFISNVMTLEEGDLILTGTPEGVGPLRPGDTVEVEILGLSRVSNTVAKES